MVEIEVLQRWSEAVETHPAKIQSHFGQDCHIPVTALEIFIRLSTVSCFYKYCYTFYTHAIYCYTAIHCICNAYTYNTNWSCVLIEHYTYAYIHTYMYECIHVHILHTLNTVHIYMHF